MKTKLQAACIILCATIMACNKSETVSLPQDTGKFSQTDPDSGRISADITVLSAEDAVKVSALYSQYSGATKSGSQKTVKSVVPVMTKDGEPAFYAVNYDDGYMLVSATKNYYPVIADVEHGTFTGEQTNTGVDILMSEILDDISFSAQQSEPTESIKEFWACYENRQQPLPSKTKGDYDDEFYEMLLKYWYEWQKQGYNVYFLYQHPENIPDDLYNRFHQRAEEDFGYYGNYADYAIILEKNEIQVTNYGKALQTKWGQNEPFNSFVGLKLGCVTIAVGQIMRYFEFPSKYNWANMPDDTSNETLSEFLAILRAELMTDLFGGADLSDAHSVLNDYGYSVRNIKHSASEVLSSLRKNNPAILGGYNANQIGHAWVCDKAYNSRPVSEYRLFLTTIDGRGVPVAMDEFDSDIKYGSEVTGYHMNWGWEGLYDGFYLDYNISTEKGNFNNDRRDLIISR